MEVTPDMVLMVLDTQVLTVLDTQVSVLTVDTVDTEEDPDTQDMLHKPLQFKKPKLKPPKNEKPYSFIEYDYLIFLY